MAWREKRAIVTVSNQTDICLVRTSFSLENGVWFKFPAERVEAKRSVSFATHSSGLLRGTEGSVTFQMLENQIPFKFVWEVPYFGTAKTDWRGPSPLVVECTEKLGPLTEVHFAITDPLQSLGETMAGEAAKELMASPGREERREEEWKSEMKKAPSSLLISLHNTTPFRMELQEHEIQRGKWAEFPPEVVESGERRDCGAVANGSFAGSRGSLVYSIAVSSGNSILTHSLPFSWAWPLFGKPHFRHKIWSLDLLPSSFNDPNALLNSLTLNGLEKDEKDDNKDKDDLHDQNHLHVILSLSNEESFILDTEFAQIPSSSLHSGPHFAFSSDPTPENANFRFSMDDLPLFSSDPPPSPQEYPDLLDRLD